MGLSMATQLILPYKMVASSAKFTILISWFLFCTLLIPCHYQLNGQELWLQQQSKIKGGQHFQGLCMRIRLSERRQFICFHFRLSIAESNLYLADEIVTVTKECTKKFQWTAKSLRKVIQNCSIWFTDFVGGISLYLK